MQISIRRFEERDIEKKVAWINDPRNNTYLHYDLPLEVEKTRLWFQKNRDRLDRFDAVIEADGVPVGLIGLLGIDDRNRKAEYYVALGETEMKGKGVAKEATRLLLTLAFTEMGLNKIVLYTEVENLGAQHLFEKVGFEREGLLREDLIYNERKVDRYVYGLTKEAFERLRDAH